MKIFLILPLLAAASCGPHREPSNVAKDDEVTVPPPSGVPASPRIPAEKSPPVATTDPPDTRD